MMRQRWRKLMVNNDRERRVKTVLKKEKTAAVKAMLEKDHAIDCLFLLYLGRGRWKDAKKFMRENGLTLSDGTFRSRMIEIENLGFAKSEHIDILKRYYIKTEACEKIAEFLLTFFEQLDR